VVACEARCDAAHLLIPGEGEERRSAAVTLRADDEQTVLRLRELSRARRRDRSAGVDVRIDLCGDARHRLECGVEIDAQLAEHPGVGSEAGESEDVPDTRDLAAV